MVSDCDGEYTYERRGALLWQLPMIDANNKSGSMEFECNGNPDDFFPVQIAFFSKKSFSGIQVGGHRIHCSSERASENTVLHLDANGALTEYKDR